MFLFYESTTGMVPIMGPMQTLCTRALTDYATGQRGKNASKCTNLQVKFPKFCGAMPPDPHTVEGLRRHSADATLPSALRRFAPSEPGSGPSAPPSSPNQKYWIQPWAHPPSENPGYAYAIGGRCLPICPNFTGTGSSLPKC